MSDWPNLRQPYIDVKADFGAVGDDTTDDTAAIQAAIDASYETGLAGASKAVYFPPGTYKITDRIVIPHTFGLTLFGGGEYISEIKQYTAGKAVFSFCQGSLITHTFSCSDMAITYSSNQTDPLSVAFFYKRGSGFENHTYERLRVEKAHTGWGFESERSFTVTIASPAVFTQTAHGYVNGDIIRFTTTGALPTGLATGTDYYVISAGLGTDTFEVSATENGSAINTSGTQSGTHTISLGQAIWGSQWRDILMGDLYYSAWDLAADTPVGQPMNGWYDIRVLNYSRQSTGPMFNLIAVTEAVMVNMDLEGWYDTIVLVGGGGECTIQGLHLENNKFDSSFSKMFIVSTGTLSVFGWTCAGNASTVNNSDQATVFHLDSGGHLILGGGVHNCDLTLGAQYIKELVYSSVANSSHVTLLGKIRKSGGDLNNPGSTAALGETLSGGVRELTYGTTIATDLGEASRYFRIDVTDGTGFTISNATNKTVGDVWTYDINNASGGAMGAITWGSEFDVTIPFTNPNNGDRRTISFMWDGTDAVQLSNNSVRKGEFYLTAAGMWPSTTAGCAANAKREEATNDVNYYTLDYDPTTQEFAECNVLMPSDWDGGTFTAQFIWTASGTSTASVVWGCRARSFGDLETLDQAFGTEQVISDPHSATAFQLQKSSATPAITAAGTPAAGEMLALKISRNPADGSDTLAVDAMLIGVRIEYTRL